MNATTLLRKRRKEFHEWDRQREQLLSSGRELTRLAGRLIRALHGGQINDNEWRRLDRVAQSILQGIQRSPWFRHAGFVQQALGEFVEARLLKDDRRSNPILADVPADALLLGLADTIGELRRRVLDQLLADDLKAARATFAQMENLFGLLMDVEAPDALVPARAKRDQARGILERTRSDLVTTKKSKDMERKIDRLGDLLDEAEGRTKPKAKTKKSDDLDLDGAWSKS